MNKLKLLITLIIALIFATTAFACSGGGMYGGDYVEINSSTINALITALDGKKAVVDADAWSGVMKTDAKATNLETNRVIYNSSAVANGQYYCDANGEITAFGSMRESAPAKNYVAMYYADGASNIAQSQTIDDQDLVVEKVDEVYEESTVSFLLGLTFSSFNIDYVKESILSATSVSASYTDEQISKIKLLNPIFGSGEETTENHSFTSSIYYVFDTDYNVIAMKGSVNYLSEQEVNLGTLSEDSGVNGEDVTSETVLCKIEEKSSFEIIKANGKPAKPSWVASDDSNSGGESSSTPGVPAIPDISEDYLGEFVTLDETGINALITALDGKTNPSERNCFTASEYMINEDTGDYQVINVQRVIDENDNLYDLETVVSSMDGSIMEYSVYYADGFMYINSGSKIKAAITKDEYLAPGQQTVNAISTCEGLASALTSGENITSVKAIKDGETFIKVEIEASASIYIDGLDGTIIINIVFDEDGNVDMIRYELNFVTTDGNMIEVVEFISNDALPTAPSDLDEYVLTE